jgi:hypothetical protein
MLMNEASCWRFELDPMDGPRVELQRYTQPILCSLELADDESSAGEATHFVEVRAWPGPGQWQWELEIEICDRGRRTPAQMPEFADRLAIDVVVPFLSSWRADIEGGVHVAAPGLADYVARATSLNHDGSCTVRLGERELIEAFSMMRAA